MVTRSANSAPPARTESRKSAEEVDRGREPADEEVAGSKATHANEERAPSCRAWAGRRRHEGDGKARCRPSGPRAPAEVGKRKHSEEVDAGEGYDLVLGVSRPDRLADEEVVVVPQAVGER